jgi:hypothetical protein
MQFSNFFTLQRPAAGNCDSEPCRGLLQGPATANSAGTCDSVPHRNAKKLILVEQSVFLDIIGAKQLRRHRKVEEI